MTDQIENETRDEPAIYDALSDTPTNYLRDPGAPIHRWTSRATSPPPCAIPSSR